MLLNSLLVYASPFLNGLVGDWEKMPAINKNLNSLISDYIRWKVSIYFVSIFRYRFVQRGKGCAYDTCEWNQSKKFQQTWGASRRILSYRRRVLISSSVNMSTSQTKHQHKSTAGGTNFHHVRMSFAKKFEGIIFLQSNLAVKIHELRFLYKKTESCFVILTFEYQYQLVRVHQWFFWF